jgi:phage shock protein A
MEVSYDLYIKNVNAIKQYVEETRDMIKCSNEKIEHLTTRVSQLEREKEILQNHIQQLLVKVYTGAV